MFDRNRLKGIITPMATPLLPDESIDVAGTRRLVNYLLQAGVNGIFVLGGTGEFPRLLDAERARAIEAVVEEVAGRVPVVAGVSDTCTARIIAHARRARQIGADVAITTLPFPIKVNTPATQLDFFQSLCSAVDMPWMIYNVPPMIGAGIAPRTFALLAQIPNMVGTKDSESVMHLQDVVDLTRGANFRVFQGNEYNLNTSLLMGAAGGTPSPSNIFPKLYVELYELTMAGRYAESAALQNRLNRYVEVLDDICGDVSSLKWPSVVKEALALLGICSPTAARPFVPCTDDDRRRIAALLKQIGL